MTPMKNSKRARSFVLNEKETRNRTTSHKLDLDTISSSKKPVKSSMKSLNSKKGSSKKSQKSVRWGSDANVLLNITNF